MTIGKILNGADISGLSEQRKAMARLIRMMRPFIHLSCNWELRGRRDIKGVGWIAGKEVDITIYFFDNPKDTPCAYVFSRETIIDIMEFDEQEEVPIIVNLV